MDLFYHTCQASVHKIRYQNAGNIGGSHAVIYCIPLDSATEEFYASVARAAGLPMEQVLRDALFKLAGELSLEALARRSRNQTARGGSE